MGGRIMASQPLLTMRTFGTYGKNMCDLSREEQGNLAALLGDLQVAEAKLSATFPEVFSRAWADHEAMLVGLADLTQAAERVREWVAAKHHSTAPV